MVNTARSPYFNDYNEKNNFHEILFVPKRAVQTRELNQIQTIFNKQIERFANHVFKEGSVVIPGEFNFDLEFEYAQVNIQNFANISPFLVEGVQLIGSSGVTATLKLFINAENSDPTTFYIEYIKAGSNNTQLRFNPNEQLSIISNDVNIGSCTVIQVGQGSKFTINSGVYYIGSRFVLVEKQTILLGKYTNKPSSSVTINYDEFLVTENEDETLFDNAQNTPNFTAPGAHRLKIDTYLKKYDLSEIENLPENAVEIFRIVDGEVQKKDDKPLYTVLGDVMALRTYEESGDYTVKAFNIAFSEYNEIFDESDDDKFVVRMESGLAYVRGYRIETFGTKNIPVEKARNTGTINNSSISANYGNYILVEDINIIPNISGMQEITFYDSVITTAGVQPTGAVLGTANVRFIRKINGTYRLYIFNIQNIDGTRNTSFITQSQSVFSSIGLPFSANIVESQLYDASANTLVFPMNVDSVKSINDQFGNTDTSYTSIKQFNSIVDTNGFVTLSSGSSEVFLVQDEQYGFATFTDNNEFIDTSNIHSLSGNPTGTVITFNFGIVNVGRPVRINAQVAKQQVNQKTKILQTTTLNSITPTLNSNIYLGQADVIRIVSVLDSGSVDITNKFTLHKNITPSYYGISFITTNSAISGDVAITFEYFQHSSGDYFGPDSYSDVSYDDIPYDDSIGSRLSDVFDFRPRMGINKDFISTGSIVGNVPIPLTVIRTDIEHYLSRIDKVYINSDGNFGVVKGIPALTPKTPEDPSNSMILYILNIPAYTFDISSINAERINNRRYTMRDIGKLEQRISNVEYYVSLNLLEQEAESMQIIDNVTGLNRFKNGFFTDSFIDHSVGNYVWEGYHVSMDGEDGEMRPEFSLNAIDLEMNYDQSNNVVENGGMVTLPFTHRSFIRQNMRSETMNVNPYAVFRWEGGLELFPSVDSWIDTIYQKPDVTYRVFNNGELTQTWASWQLNWTGGLTTQTSNRTITSPSHSEWQSGNSTEPGAWTHGAWARGGFRRSTRTFTTTTTTRTNIDIINDRIIDTSVVPYMRSIDVRVEGIGHRPEAKMNFFFDSINVNEYVKPINGEFNENVVSDVDGNFTAIYRIPNNNEIKFRTGERVLVVTDEEDGVQELSTSWADANFTSTGTRQVRKQTIVATRSVDTSTEQTSVRWHDPLAQSFLVERTGGVFATKIDVFFATKDDNVPVTVEIREMENGAPTQNIIPGARKTILPRDVNLSEDGSIATTFEFPYPVYLSDGAEYCFVIWSNSNNYEAFIARMGEKDLGTQQYIVEQPYAGVLFKSQNNSTWTADQTADLQFEIYTAKFETNVIGELILNNGDLDDIILDINPIETTIGSNVVGVKRNKHNFVVGAAVEIKNAIGGNGITDASLNKQHVVHSIIDPNTVGILVDNVASDSGFIGGDIVTMSNMIQASVLNPNIPTIEISGTVLEFLAKGTSGQSFDGTEVPYQKMTDYVSISNGSINEINFPWLFTNQLDETTNLQGNKSLELKALFFTENDNLSPVIDMQGNSIITPFMMITKKSPVLEDGTNNWANYVNKFVTLTTPANSIKIFMDTYEPQGSEVIVSSRFGNSQEEMIESDWVIMNSDVSNLTESIDNFKEKTFYLDEVGDFTFYQIMIQLKSDSSVRYPKCRRLRVIALGT